MLSAGGAIETCRAVASRQLKNAIAVIRPPGHHAEQNRPMGFCMFDNVAIAAKVCQIDYKQTCRKILIVDWDVHHGNGIQQAFYSDPNVLYISLHVHEDGRFYPAGPYGDHLHCGTGAGEGKNINVPWPTKGMGDADYMFAFQHVVMPVAYDFDPDLVIIAAGFDAAAGDQLGGCFVTPTCYAHMTHMLMSLAEGKLVVCLEVRLLCQYHGKLQETEVITGRLQSQIDLEVGTRSYPYFDGGTTRSNGGDGGHSVWCRYSSEGCDVPVEILALSLSQGQRKRFVSFACIGSLAN